MLWEATVRLSDPILDLIKTDESLEFISLKEAINLLARKTNSSTFGVATYLLNKKVHILLNSHSRQNDYKIEATSSAIDQDYWSGENDCYFWLNYIAENDKHYPSFSIGDNSKYNAGCQESFWKRGEFFDLECIRSLNLLSTGEWNTVFQKQQYIWDAHYLNLVKNDVPDLIEIDSDIYVNESINFEDELTYQEVKKLPLYFKNNTFTPNQVDGLNDNLSTQETIGCGQPSIQQVEPNIENLNGEIVRLRNLLADQTTEIQDLKSKIQELETPPTIQNDKPDLLALILDETQTDRYAPDLVYSIKLWLDVYVNNPKADSHNNKANTWIKNNTPYNGEQDDTPTRRIREIATPLRDLHQSRKRLLENK